MKNRTKNIASVAAIGLFSLFAIASVDEEPESTPAEMRAATAELSVTANKIAKDFDENEVAANLKYENKIIEVTGSVGQISKDFGDYNLMLDTSQLLTGVVCRFNGNVAEQLAVLKTGQNITIKGRCDGMYGNVEIKDCVIITQ